jgi:hypothetical protein
MTTLRDPQAILREVQDLLRSAPQGELDPEVARERIGEAIHLLAGQEPIWIDAAEAKQLLGIVIDATVPFLAQHGLLRGRTLPDGRLQVRLDDVFHERATREALLAFPGEELTPEELRIMREARPGKNPWERETEPTP